MAGGYPDLVAPIVPDAQKNKSSELLLEGLRGGLSFMAQMNQQRRQSESDVARMALQERLANQEHELNAQKLSQSYELDNRRMKVEEALMPAKKRELEARADYEATTKGIGARKVEAHLATLNDFNLRVAKYGLDDPNPKDPVKFYANARRLKDEFSWANIPDIKLALKQVDMRTKEHTIPLNVNQAVKDPETGDTVIQPITKLVPIGEIIEGLKDPKKYDQVMKTIERSGLLKDDATGNKALRAAIQEETKRVESGGGTDFSRSRSRVTPGVRLANPTNDADLPEGEPPPQPDVDESDLFGSIGQTDKWISQARAALKRGASPKAVAERLNSFGVDPNQLWAT